MSCKPHTHVNVLHMLPSISSSEKYDIAFVTPLARKPNGKEMDMANLANYANFRCSAVVHKNERKNEKRGRP